MRIQEGGIDKGKKDTKQANWEQLASAAGNKCYLDGKMLPFVIDPSVGESHFHSCGFCFISFRLHGLQCFI